MGKCTLVKQRVSTRSVCVYLALWELSLLFNLNWFKHTHTLVWDSFHVFSSFSVSCCASLSLSLSHERNCTEGVNCSTANLLAVHAWLCCPSLHHSRLERFTQTTHTYLKVTYIVHTPEAWNSHAPGHETVLIPAYFTTTKNEHNDTIP